MTSHGDLRASGAPRAVSGGCLRPVLGVRGWAACCRAGADQHVTLSAARLPRAAAWTPLSSAVRSSLYCGVCPLSLRGRGTLPGRVSSCPCCDSTARLVTGAMSAPTFQMSSQTLESQDPCPCQRLVPQSHCYSWCRKWLSAFRVGLRGPSPRLAGSYLCELWPSARPL